MPIYFVRRLDIVGNPVDGYEVNDSRDAGEVYIQPQSAFRDDPTTAAAPYDYAIVEALVDGGLLSNQFALRGLEQGEVTVDHADDIEVSTQETAFSGEWGVGGERRYIAMAPEGDPASRRDTLTYERAQAAAEEQLLEGETLVVDRAPRPLYSLHDPLGPGGHRPAGKVEREVRSGGDGRAQLLRQTVRGIVTKSKTRTEV